MKKVVSFISIGLLAACSASPEQLQSANDSYQKSDASLPTFAPLSGGGVNLPQADDTYALPAVRIAKGAQVDIRPPTIPLAIINHSFTRFDGERAIIVYPEQQASIYNLQQIRRLLKEEGIGVEINGATLISDWAPLDRLDESENTQIRYQVEHIHAQGSSALAVSVSQMRRDGILFTPTLAEKQRYASTRLNRFVSSLTGAYNQQIQALENQNTGPISSALGRDMNGRAALVLNASFNRAWEKLGTVLPKVGFNIEEETVGRGQRELKYSELDKGEWSAFGINRPQLDNGTYYMQLSTLGSQSSIVITDEDGKTLPNEEINAIYQALSYFLAK